MLFHEQEQSARKIEGKERGERERGKREGGISKTNLVNSEIV